MFLSSCYFIYNTRRNTAAEKKEFDIVIRMTEDHVLVQRFKTKELLIKTCKCYKASKFLYKNDLATSLF